MSGPTTAVRALVWERDGGACAWCGRPVRPEDHSLQHRRARGMGGTRRRESNLAANLLLTCGSAVTGCHGHMESCPGEASRRGFRLYQVADPVEVPVLYAGGVWVRLDHSGGWTAVSRPVGGWGASA